jgi:DNA replication and repair protein RecF
MFGEQYFDAKGTLSDSVDNNVRIFFELEKGKKNFYLDDKTIYNSSAIIGKFPIVTLVQSDHAITQGAPADRRRFVDSVISQASHAYLEILLEFNKTLKQRSSLLTQIKENRNNNLFDQLEAWTESLIITGSEIIKHRSNFAAEFNSYLADAYKHVIENIEIPHLEYFTISEIDGQNIHHKFREELNSKREDEIRRGMNLVGPHRDDYIFFIDDLELKRFGSQGQHKTFQISLRFGQFFFMKEKLNKTPIFLMDDVFGELDVFRAGKISEYLPQIGQTFITMTDLTKLENLNNNKENLLIKIENGKAAYA